MALALAVVISHLCRLALGEAAVYVFFSLSGYWISKLWKNKYSNMKTPYATFIASRCGRIFPIYWVGAIFAVGSVLAAGQSFFSSDDSRAHWLLSSVFILGTDGLTTELNAPAWSLDLEMQFYIIAPLLISLLGFFNVRLAFFCALVVSVLSAVFIGRSALTSYFIFFAAGSLATRARPVSMRIAASSFCLFAISVVGILVSPWRDVILCGESPSSMYLNYHSHAAAALAIILMPLAFFTVRLPSGNVDSAFGDLSFVVYMVHLSIIRLVHLWIPGADLRTRIVAAVVAAVVTGLASVMLWWGIDRPLNRLRSNWVASRKERLVAIEQHSVTR